MPIAWTDSLRESVATAAADRTGIFVLRSTVDNAGAASGDNFDHFPKSMTRAPSPLLLK